MSKPTPPALPGDDQENTPANRRPSLTQQTYQSIVDQRIAAAEAAGMFNDLPGSGKPINLDDDSHVPEEDRAAYRMLKNAGFAPPWIELQKRIRAEQSNLAAWLEHTNHSWQARQPLEQQDLYEEYRRRLVELNRMIIHYNLSVPPAAGQMATLRLPDELARLGEPG